jgi:hypothetical protein
MSVAPVRHQEERKLKREFMSQRPSRVSTLAHDRRRCSVVAALALALAGASAPATAQAAAPLSWSKPVSVDAGQTPSAIACPSEALCVAVDRHGQVLHTTGEPASPSPSWSAPRTIDAGRALTALACAPIGLCAAVDESGAVLTSTEPEAEAGAGRWQRASIDSEPLTGVSCPSARLCVAVDQAGSAFASTDPGALDPSWTATDIDGGTRLRGVSCPSESLCVAVDAEGRVLTSSEPGAADPGWQARALDATGELVAVSCASAQLCVATDGAGDALASADPGASQPTWNTTQIDLTAVPASLSCASSGLCAAVDEAGDALASDDPTSGLPVWNVSSPDAGTPLAGVSCLPDGVCMAIDTAGGFVRATVPAPAATTGSASEITPTEATLTGAVNPQDAVLGQCTLEYGPTTAYGQTASCSPQPTPTGGQQTVQARITGLAPASVYHFRVQAANAGGATSAADGTFTTMPALGVVHPSPYILGLPANGVRLYCQPGTSGSATLTYAWVRDATVIAGATGSSYVVTGADAQHHLQCRVTATNAAGSATASSAFVAVPAMGVLAASGETEVGKVSASATAIVIPVTCSAQAPAGCAIAVHVTTRQTRTDGKGKRARRVTVTVSLASASVHLERGERRTLTLPLSAADRSLLGRVHRLTATVSVTGTVIGELKASLAKDALTLHDPPTRGHGARGSRATSTSHTTGRARSTRGRAAQPGGSRGRAR